jgi:hypothetical protein
MEVNRLFDSLDTCICQSISVKITRRVSKIAGYARVVLDLLHHNHKEQ